MSARSQTCKQNRFEALLSAYASETEGLSAAMADASRYARLRVPASNLREESLRDVAAGVIAPTLTAYVLWVLRRNSELDIMRLYFLSREGQVLLSIARSLITDLDLPYDARYLYASRQSWHLPAIISGTDEEIDRAWNSPASLSVRGLLARVDLAPEEAKQSLCSAGFSSGEWSRPLQPLEVHAIAQALRPRIRERAQQARRVFLRYLVQEGMFDDTPCALVDVGWHGNLQESLSEILSQAGRTMPASLCFALRKDSSSLTDAPIGEAYYFDEYRGLGQIGSVPGIIALMEMFCAGDEGSVVGFAEQGNTIKPVLAEPQNRRVIDWGLPILRETVSQFLVNLELDEIKGNSWADMRRAVTSVLRAFWLHPSLEEARFWGHFPFECGSGSERSWIILAERYRWRDLLSALRQNGSSPRQWAAWPPASLALSSWPVRVACTLSHPDFSRRAGCWDPRA